MFLGPERNRFIVKRAGQKSEFVSDHVYSIIFDQPKRRRVDRGLRPSRLERHQIRALGLVFSGLRLEPLRQVLSLAVA